MPCRVIGVSGTPGAPLGCLNASVQGFVCTCASISLECKPRGGTPGSRVTRCLRNSCPFPLPSSATRSPASPHPCQHLLLSESVFNHSGGSSLTFFVADCDTPHSCSQHPDSAHCHHGVPRSQSPPWRAASSSKPPHARSPVPVHVVGTFVLLLLKHT